MMTTTTTTTMTVCPCTLLKRIQAWRIILELHFKRFERAICLAIIHLKNCRIMNQPLLSIRPPQTLRQKFFFSFFLSLFLLSYRMREYYMFIRSGVWSNNATTKISAQPSREMHSGRLLWSRRSSTKASSQRRRRRRRVMRISLFWAKRDG